MKVKGIGINADSSTMDGNSEMFKNFLKFFQETGFDYVEVPVHGLDLILNGKLDMKQLKKFKEIIKNFNLKFTVHSADRINLMLNVSTDKHFEVFKSTIQFASEIGAETLAYHSSTAHFTDNNLETYYFPRYGRKYRELIFKELLEEEVCKLQELAEYAKDLGVVIAVENLPVCDVKAEYTYGLYPHTLVELIKRVNRPNVGITFDFGHGYIASKKYGFDFLEGVKCVEPYLKHVHIHDNCGCTDNGEKNIDRIPLGLGDMHMPIGWGEIPYNEVFKIIENYSGVFTMELMPRYFPYFKEALETARQAIEGSRL